MQAKLAVKDEYTFDFFEMGLEHSEQELEIGLVNNVRAFLSEMGGNFTFIGNQYHISLDGDDFYIDLCTLSVIIEALNDKFELGIKEIIKRLMMHRMKDNDDIVTRYLDDEAFQKTALGILAQEMYANIIDVGNIKA